VTIRPATVQDLSAMAAIQGLSPEASHWNPATYLQYICTVCELDGRVQGFVVVRAVGGGENEVLNLAVDPVARRRGVAKALLAQAFGAIPGCWFLEVRESNAVAIGLYQSLGFVAAGTRPGYYSDGPNGSPEPAIVMRFQSC
jgi:[ribosomal protein S18]-alanine N-acetyltransferase